jgi:DNA-binding winged helix-turn-helix (wHTH) protein
MPVRAAPCRSPGVKSPAPSAELAQSPLAADASPGGTLLAVLPVNGGAARLAIVGYLLPVAAGAEAMAVIPAAAGLAPAAMPMAAMPVAAMPAPGGRSAADGMMVDGLLIDAAQRRVLADGRDADLVYQEFELLRFLMAHPGQAFTRAQLAERAWGEPQPDGSRTVDVHVHRLRRKLGPKYGSRLRTVRRVGYLYHAPTTRLA